MTSISKNRALTWLQRIAVLIFLSYVGYLAVGQFRQLDSQEVIAAVRTYGAGGIAIAALIAVPGVLACSCFDLIGRHVVGHDLSAKRTMLISFAGYYFSLNLGALAGGLAFRYRLYSANGLRLARITKIVGLTVVTNWLGYILLAGIVLAFAPPGLPAGWGPGSAALRLVGGFFLGASVAYIATCHLRGGSELKIRGFTIPLPTLPVALLQFALSLTSWGAITMVLVWLLPAGIAATTVLPVLMISAIAGIWSHVPGGLGVIEVVFLTLLSDQAPDNALIAAVLMFRAIYYLTPFCFAVVGYLYLERTRRKQPDLAA